MEKVFITFKIMIDIKYIDKRGNSMAKIYTIDQSLCVSCGTCDMECRFGAIIIDDQGKFSVDAEKCRGCGLCAASCPVDAALPGA